MIDKEMIEYALSLGFILSNPAGTENAARVYWSNKDTGLVSDIPHEARMYPAKMGTLTLK